MGELCLHLKRLARNEILFRAVNERLDDMGAATSCQSDRLPLRVQRHIVHRDDRARRESIRARTFTFPCLSLVPGHERPELEKVIEEHEHFLLVEKTVAVDAVKD